MTAAIPTCHDCGHICRSVDCLNCGGRPMQHGDELCFRCRAINKQEPAVDSVAEWVEWALKKYPGHKMVSVEGFLSNADRHSGLALRLDCHWSTAAYHREQAELWCKRAEYLMSRQVQGSDLAVGD